VIFLYGVLALLAALAVLFFVLIVKVRQASRAPEQPNCYYCGSAALHISAPRGLTDRLLTYWNCVPYRCEVCFHRHYRLAAEPAADE
jgi:hypothetical protein